MIKTIDIYVKEWFDKVNGNSYFSGTVTINYKMKGEKSFGMPFQYGYGDHYIDRAKQELVERGLIKPEKMQALWRYCDENNIILRGFKKENCLKKEVK